MAAGETRRINRRTFLRGLGLTVGTAAVFPLLEACGGGTGSAASTVTNSGSTSASSATSTGTTAQTALQPKRGGTLRYGLDVEPQRMNALNTTWMTDATEHLYDELLTRDHQGNYVEQLSTWEISPDKLTWTFHLRPNVKFHSGDPLTADAIVWWFNQATNPKGFYGFKGSYASVDSASATDTHTVVVKMKHPDASLEFILYTVYSAIMNPKTYQKYGPDEYGVKTVDGTGPFKFQEWVQGDHLTIVRNDAYAWAPPFVKNQGPPYLDAVRYQYYADATARSTAIQSGDLDIVVNPNLADVDKLKQNSNLTVVTRPEPGIRVVDFNCQKAPLSDKRVRQAFASAILRAPIVQKLLFNQGLPAYSIVPPSFTDMYLPATEHYFPYDANKGKQLLTAAGLTAGGSQGTVQYQGQPWEPEMLVTSASDLVQLAQVVQAQAAQIGVKIKITELDQATLTARTEKGDFDIITSFYLWDGPDTMYDWWFYSGNIGSTNSSRLKDPSVDALIVKMRSTGTLTARYDVVKQLQQVIHGDLVPIIPVYEPYWIYVMSNKVHGYTPNIYTLYPRMHDTWLG